MSEDTIKEVAGILFGNGADELVSKLSQDPAVKDRRQRKITAGLSAAGGAAGALGLAAGANDFRAKSKEAKVAGDLSNLKAIKAGWKATPKLTRALIPAEVVGLGGEVMATHILHNDTKKKIPVPKTKKNYTLAKSEPTSSDVHISAGTLKRKAGTAALKHLNNNKQLNEEKVEVGRKVKEKFGKSFTWEGEFSKIDADKRQVFGWASITEMNGEPVYDLQGDFIDTDEIEKSAYDYVIKSRKGGDMHRRNPDDTPVHSSDMIESFMVTPEKIEKMGLPEGSLPTGWWVGFQVNDDDAWNLVKSGKRTAFSIHGRGQRTPMEG